MKRLIKALAFAAAATAAGPVAEAGPGAVGTQLDVFDEGEDADEDDEDLLELDLEDLLDIEVSVVSRRTESIDGAPAAVYVISGEEIRRAGHSSVQEALRMVPGTFVSHWNDADWDVTIRGFGPGAATANQAYHNQVLVMLDGVVVYSPLFPGMWWGLQDLDLEHIDRIEVIRGPSGILWGANAFHGLINIITKTSADVDGERLSVRVSGDDSFITARSSGALDDGVTYSAFARRTRYDALNDSDLTFSDDLYNWGINSGGVDLAGTTDSGLAWRLWGRGYEASTGRGFQDSPTTFFRVEDPQYGGQLSLNLSDPSTGLNIRTAYVKERGRFWNIDSAADIDSIQFEISQQLEPWENHRLQYGFGYDLIHSRTDFFLGAFVDSIRQNNFRAYVSDTWDIPESNLSISFGAQAIQHEFSGFDLQPSLRASWTPHDYSSYWISASRAVRTPSIEEEVLFVGDPRSESVLAIEAGWRGEVAEGVSVDLALYYNDYEDVRTEVFDENTFDFRLLYGSTGSSRGVEVGVDAKLADWWTLRGAYSTHFGTHDSNGVDPNVDFVDSQYPVHLFNLRSYVDLAEDWELDVAAYVVERFEDHPVGGDGPEYWRGDVRVGWDVCDDVRLAFGVQGFNDSLRSEYGPYERQRLYYLAVDLTR